MVTWVNRIWLTAVVGVLLAVAFLAGSIFNHGAVATESPGTSVRAVLYYRDPMHPSFTSDRPGKAPDCGMALEPVYADKQGWPPDVLHVSSERQQIIGVRLGRVETSSVTQPLRSLGRVLPDEARVFPLIAGAEGWVRKIFPSATGSFVREGQPLVTVYGRDYMTAQRTLLYAVQALEKNPKPPNESLQEQSAFNVQEARLNLQDLGFGAAQVQQILSNHQASLEVTLAAPADGIVVARNVFPQQRFDRGAELFRIADLRYVWIVADMFGDEAKYIQSGATARVSLAGNPGTALRATVSDTVPRFDPASRTFKVRLEAANQGLTLRPDMFVDIEFLVSLPAATTVPRDAVLESGLRKIVFVDRGQGIFEPRPVETGWRFGDRVQIIRGLQPGESIVVSGNFFLDAESRMRQGANRGHD
jgi:Cu(I)/Ag(I) efflux system membrane fusion protein